MEIGIWKPDGYRKISTGVWEQENVISENVVRSKEWGERNGEYVRVRTSQAGETDHFKVY